jgi:hypothetical protein
MMTASSAALNRAQASVMDSLSSDEALDGIFVYSEGVSSNLERSIDLWADCEDVIQALVK